MKKAISISRLMDYDKCPELYRKNETGGRRRVVTVREVAGDAGHRIAGGESVESAREFVERTLVDATPELREAVMERAIQFSADAVEMDDDEVTTDNKEVQLVLEKFGWKIFAKPDQLFYTKRNGRDVMVIKDIKSGSFVSGRHKRQIFWFGLIAAESLNWTGWIDLVVSLPDTGEEVTFRYSHREAVRKLAELRLILEAIERDWFHRDFEARPRPSCSRCKFFAECPIAQAFIEKMEGRDEIAHEVSPNVVPIEALLSNAASNNAAMFA